MIVYTDLRDGCYACGPDHSNGSKRPRLVPRGQWIVCEKCGGSYADATPENVRHLEEDDSALAAPVTTKEAEG